MAKTNSVNIQTTKTVIPKIYAYTTPEIRRHDGWTKIGYTEQDDVKERIYQQTHTADIAAKYEWSGNAIFENTNTYFKDKAFHAYLRKKGYEQTKGTEWLHIEPTPAKEEFYKFREDQGIINDINEIEPYDLREEQNSAVNEAINYFDSHTNGEFLWNCKPRFGKTLAAYDLCKRIDAQNVLIVTNRPAISTSWYADYEKFLGTASGYRFVSDDSNLINKSLVLPDEEYTRFKESNRSDKSKRIMFLSLQDLKGSVYFHGDHDKLKCVKDTLWDLLIIDEAHEGVDTYKTNKAFEEIRRKRTLHLSGTPFKALASDKFLSDAIFNWTYADEQAAKRDWNKEEDNPYEDLPKLNLFTYQMSEVVKDVVERGFDLDDEKVSYAFDLNEFFKTDERGVFVHNQAVDMFLDALTKQERFPFSTEELRNELKHTFWLLDRVNSAKALMRKLQDHPVFKDYKIILAAGDGRLNDDEESIKSSYIAVTEAIKNEDKTITLSVGQLTTGVTIPEWTGVLMLCNLHSPAQYMQAAFRAQNPNLFFENREFKRKENAYVFDFDPARTLLIYESFANDLYSKTSGGKGNDDDRKANIKELLNFFTVYGEDDSGRMIALDPEKVLRIPRKIKSKEVVKRGFMSNFLFQNISLVFNGPKTVTDIINSMEAVKEPSKNNREDLFEKVNELDLDENGEVDIPEEIVVGTAADLFGERIYDTKSIDIVEDLLGASVYDTPIDEFTQKANTLTESIAASIKSTVIDSMIDATQEDLGRELKRSERNELESTLQGRINNTIRSIVDDYKRDINVHNAEELHELDKCYSEEGKDAVAERFEEKRKEVMEGLKSQVNSALDSFITQASEEVVRKVEESKQKEIAKNIEDNVKDRLRGFTRTIPSFLMAYGDDTVTLDTFDQIIPDEVFKEVTGITLDQFRFLRDGGDYEDEDTLEAKHFDGNIFDRTVFNDSITEFLKLRNKLSNYFDESQNEDIFDYVPPQKTNQIFTPKWVVKKMVDMLEEENPGCFSDPDNTFADLYMKSGLYIAEIVKKLFNDAHMKELFPDETARLQHIFAKQVYGLAPTEIIYRIATNFILGFNEKINIPVYHFAQADALEYAKEGTLQEKIDELFDE